VSAGLEAIVAVSVIVVPPVTCTVVVKVALDPEASDARVQVKVVVPVQVQPEAVGDATSVVLAGSASVYVTLEAEDGPVYVITCVNVT
jgi:hypothetical protein